MRMPEGHYIGHPNVIDTPKRKSFFCNDCKVSPFWHFRIKNELWETIATLDAQLLLCQPCTEKRIGRPLKEEDFEGDWN